MTSDCRAHYKNNLVVKFADDTAVVGLITQGDESGYRREVEDLTRWCGDNNLNLNIQKTKEMVVDFRRSVTTHPTLYINGAAVETAPSVKYLGVHLTSSLTWQPNTTAVTKKAHQRLYFLRKLRGARLDAAVLKAFYSCAVESVLTSCLTVWYGSCTVAEKEALQRVVKAAQRTIGCSLPPIGDIYTTRCRERALSILHDPTHPAQELFTPMPSGRRLRSIRARTTRLKNSFFPEAVRLLNCSATRTLSTVLNTVPAPILPFT